MFNSFISAIFFAAVDGLNRFFLVDYLCW